MRPLTFTTPKPMIPFLNKPVMEHIILKLAEEGFKESIITTNFKPDVLEGYFDAGKKWGLDVHIVDEDEPLGTAGSVKNALHHLDETFAVVQGDNISEIDLSAMFDYHHQHDASFTIALRHVEDVTHYGIAEMDGEEIIAYQEKPPAGEAFSNLANTGIYILEPEVLDMIPLEFFDFSHDLFPKMLSQGKKICGWVTDAFWRDVGTPEAYMEATQYFLKGENNIGDANVTDSDLTASVIGDGCSVKDSYLIGSVLFPRTRVDEAKLDSCIIGSGCRIGKGAEIRKGSILGDGCVVGDGAVIGCGARLGPGHIVGPGDNVSGDVPSTIDW